MTAKTEVSPVMRELSTYIAGALRGTSDNPMSRAEVEEKSLPLLAPSIGTRRARALCDAVWNIEAIADTCELRPLLRA